VGRSAPSGSDIDEWRLWLGEHAGYGPGYLAEQIAAAMDRWIAGANPVKSAGDLPAPESGSWPRITGRMTSKVSPWVELVAREVEFSPGARPQVYHSIATFDFVVVLALTRDGRIPLVRQYRPAVEGFTLEFPGGMIEAGEDPAHTAARELWEETGLPSEQVHPLGVNKNDAGRLGNRVHSYLIRTGPQIADFEPEAGIAIRFVTISELIEAIRTGELDAQTNLGTLFLAVLLGYFRLPN
jgi:ADP-ribose pyrophosphatase